MALVCFGNKRRLSLLLEPPLEMKSKLRNFQTHSYFPREVATIKVEAYAKRHSMETKGNALADHYVKQAGYYPV